MDPNLETPSGCISLRLQHLAESLSNCPTWQSICNAGDAAQALSHIWEESLPMPEQEGANYSIEELRRYRPYALISAESITRTRIAAVSDYDASGQMLLRIVRGVPDEQSNDFLFSAREFNNILGNIIDELLDLAGTPGMIEIDEIEMPEGWYRTETEDERREGDLQIADLLITAGGI